MWYSDCFIILYFFCSLLGNTALTYACAGGFIDIVKVLLNEGANIEDHNENGHTPLMEAASAGHVEVARVLLDHGAGINTHSNEFKESALTLACYKGTFYVRIFIIAFITTSNIRVLSIWVNLYIPSLPEYLNLYYFFFLMV